MIQTGPFDLRTVQKCYSMFTQPIHALVNAVPFISDPSMYFAITHSTGEGTVESWSVYVNMASGIQTQTVLGDEDQPNGSTAVMDAVDNGIFRRNV